MPGATFFGADNYFAGQLAGEALAKWVNENWDGAGRTPMLVLELPQSGPVPAARMQGMIDAFQENVETPSCRGYDLPPGQQEHAGRVLPRRERYAAGHPGRCEAHRRRDHQ